MSLTLRPYQSAIIEDIRGHLRSGRSSVLCVLPTGAGKTVIAAHMISKADAKEKRSWFTCHRVELVRQSVQTLQIAAGLHVGIIAAGFNPNGIARTQVCSIQSLMRRWQKHALPDLIIVDEAAHIAARSWSNLLAAVRAAKPSIKVIGLTATPQRLDGRGLGQWFEVMVQGPQPSRLMAEGYLSRYTVFAPSQANLSAVHTVAGDYNRAELDTAMRGCRVTGDAIAEYRAKCDGKRALMFLWSVKASEEMAAAFNAIGIPAAHIDGMTNDFDRARAVCDFGSGKIKVLTNCELICEGFDCPAIDAVFLLRPTQSLAMYLQMIGRGLRPAPGKDRVLIMDHSGLCLTHGLPDEAREWSLAGAETTSHGKPSLTVRQCLKCYAVWPANARSCKECGFLFPIQYREVEQEQGELQELDMAAMERLFNARTRRQEQGRADSYEDLVRIERQRGYRPGWARHIIEARERKRDSLSVAADSYRPAGRE